MSSVSENSDCEWEEVESSIPQPEPMDISQNNTENAKEEQKDIEITIKPALNRKKQNLIERLLKEYDSSNRLAMHKTHLQLLIERLLIVNEVCNNKTLQAALLSLLPVCILNLGYAPVIKRDIQCKLLLELLVWYKSNIGWINQCLDKDVVYLVCSHRIGYTSVFLSLIRAIGYTARMVQVLTPTSAKSDSYRGISQTRKRSNNNNNNKKNKNQKNSQNSEYFKEIHNNTNASNSSVELISSSYFNENSTYRETRLSARLKKSYTNNNNNNKNNNNNNNNNNHNHNHNHNHNQNNSMNDKSYIDNNEDFQNKQTSSDEDFELHQRKRRKVGYKSKQKINKNKNNNNNNNSNDDDDDDGKAIIKKSLLKGITQNSETLQVQEATQTATGDDNRDEWVEVYLEARWQPLSYSSGSIGDVTSTITPNQAMTYVVSVDEENYIYDVTARYNTSWAGKFIKDRPDHDWWISLIKIYSNPSKLEINEREEAELTSLAYSRCLPNTLNDFKANPFYVLDRNIRKFQSIYPPDCIPVSTFRGENVYYKSNLVELHTRENWLKEGLIIKKNQLPYKVSKGRNKPGTSEERTIDLFGKWQTEVYVAPPVINGVISKNEYGNIELFQPFMLPEGAAHIELPGVNHVTKRLGLDYALAMVGWEFHGIMCHPVFRGVVVAAENEQVVREAWREEKTEREKKNRAARRYQLALRWRRLVKLIVIRDRVKQKYNM